jgi:hypothetical protein
MTPVYKFSNAGGLTSKQRYTSMLAGNLVFVSSSFESIATVNVGLGGSSSVSFSSIPSTYKHLQLRFIAKSTTSAINSDTLRITLNGNSITKNHALYGDGSSALAFVGANGDIGIIPRVLATFVFGAGVVDILDASDTAKNKTIRSLGGYDNNGSGELAFYSNLYSTNTNAIDSITLSSSANNLAQYSSFALYGIKDS